MLASTVLGDAAWEPPAWTLTPLTLTGSPGPLTTERRVVQCFPF